MKKEKNRISRAQFLGASSLGILSMGLSPLLVENNAEFSDNMNENLLPDFGIVGWTFNYISTSEAIKMMKDLGVKKTTLKPDVQLPVNSSDTAIKETVAQYKDAGISIYGVGVIYMDSKKEIDEGFAYAQKVGVPIIVAAPKQDLLEYVDKKVKEYDIKVAIHNHGPDETGGGLYPGAKEVYEKVEDLDKRIGLCYDIGHAVRAGEDPIKAIQNYKERIFDMHFKDVTRNDREGKSLKVGGSDGVINIVAVMETLLEVGYNGAYSLEYEDNMKEPLTDIAQSIGYLNGVKDTLTP